MKKSSKKSILIFLILSTLVVVLAIIVAEVLQEDPTPLIQGNHIVRTYDQLLPFLEAEPIDISQQKYESHIPSIIQQDIQLMLESSQDLGILYTNDKDSSSIQIHKNPDVPSGLLLSIYGTTYQSFRDFFSFYRTENGIVVYGTSLDSRRLQKCNVDIESSLVDTAKHFDCISVDLCGVKRHFDDVYYTLGDSTLCRDDNEFMLYHLGEQLGKTTVFPGGKIVKLTDTYIVDDQQNLYYLYYCLSPDDPWIFFVLVDENIESVSSVPVQTDDHASYFPYYKDGKKYVGMVFPLTEELFGQHYVSNHDEIAPSALSFSVEIIELNPSLASYIILRKENASPKQYEWCVRYYYSIYGQFVYEKERIANLNPYEDEKLSQKEMKQFDGKKVTLEQLSEVIEQLRQAYLTCKN